MNTEIVAEVPRDSTDSVCKEFAPWDSPRLPKHIRPEKYNLFLYPKIDSNTFDGDVLIDVIISEPTSYILVHQTNLKIEFTRVSPKSSPHEKFKIEKTWPYPKNHYWIIQLTETLLPGKYEIFFSFKGTLSSCTLGLYKTTYKDALDDECSCILSYFEATYARCAFPCFDEPSFRAVFNIKIAHHTSGRLVALSNMCREKETLNHPSPGVNTVHFRPTPLMPPYLTAMIVGDFLYTVPSVTKNNVSVAVYSRREIIPSMIKARDLAVAILDFFSEYFDCPYDLPKLDLIAIPDSNISGMENWGLITFREDRLLLNDESTCDDYLLVCDVIGHEISHMWFGDLVSISWWDNLWLKEGFATYMACVSGKKMYPEWFNEWVIITYVNNAFRLDAALGSHPLVQCVETTEQIREVFDAISYEKGASLVRMLCDLDSDGFQLAIRSYLKRYKYTSTVTKNLWDEIQENVNFNVSTFMDTWTLQMGYPVLQVEHCYGKKIIVSQSRFLLSKHFTYNPDDSPFKYKWDVPIKYVTSDDLNDIKLIWLPRDQESVALECSDRVGWVKLNWHQVGFYRVNYPNDQWDLFSAQLIRNPAALDYEDRANLIEDAFTLASAGYFYYHIPLNLIQYFKFGKEKHFYPWSIAASHLYYIGSRLAGTDAYDSFMKYVHLLIKGNLTDDIWTFGDSFLKTKLQLELIKLACWSEEPDTLQIITNLFNEWLTNGKRPHHELHSLVYSYGLANKTTFSVEIWNRVLNHMLNDVKDVQARLKFWQALGNARDKDCLIRLIELAKDEQNLKSQDFFLVLNMMAKHSMGLEVVWDFIRNEWEYLVERFTLEDTKLCRILHNLCSQFGTEERLNEVKEFYKKYPEAGSGARLRVVSLENINRNISWSTTNYATLKEYLNK